MWLLRNPFLGVNKHVGEMYESVTRVEVERRINAGISWKSLGEGIVPIFEEHTARIECRYSVDQWYALAPMERALIIAQKRIENAMKAHYAEAEAKMMKRETSKPRRK